MRKVGMDALMPDKHFYKQNHVGTGVHLLLSLEFRS
jgi:hypothetical protein